VAFYIQQKKKKKGLLERTGRQALSGQTASSDDNNNTTKQKRSYLSRASSVGTEKHDTNLAAAPGATGWVFSSNRPMHVSSLYSKYGLFHIWRQGQGPAFLPPLLGLKKSEECLWPKTTMG
jgi:hypothetical protein